MSDFNVYQPDNTIAGQVREWDRIQDREAGARWAEAEARTSWLWDLEARARVEMDADMKHPAVLTAWGLLPEVGPTPDDERYLDLADTRPVRELDWHEAQELDWILEDLPRADLVDALRILAGDRRVYEFFGSRIVLAREGVRA